MSENVLAQALIAEAKFRLLDESLPRIIACLDQLTETEIWFRPNPNTNAIGNLILHLCGNVTQWIISGLGGAPDRRNRDSEFAERGPIPASTLIATLNHTMAEVGRTLDQIDPESLLQVRHVQGRPESGLAIIVHVVEHFSYHTGQITFAVKSRKNIDTGYYAGRDLSMHNA